MECAQSVQCVQCVHWNKSRYFQLIDWWLTLIVRIVWIERLVKVICSSYLVCDCDIAVKKKERRILRVISSFHSVSGIKDGSFYKCIPKFQIWKIIHYLCWFHFALCVICSALYMSTNRNTIVEFKKNMYNEDSTLHEIE